LHFAALQHSNRPGSGRKSVPKSGGYVTKFVNQPFKIGVLPSGWGQTPFRASEKGSQFFKVKQIASRMRLAALALQGS
jgi:hypothetical protein